MKTQSIEKFNVIGIAIRTTNENGQSSQDIPALWNKFMSEGILDKISDKVDSTIYCLYTDYEKDHTKPYTTILGCKVKKLDNIPQGMTGKTIEGGSYGVHVAKGNLLQGVVYDAWLKIWDTERQRAYTTDFEVYGAKAQNRENAEVEIFVQYR